MYLISPTLVNTALKFIVPVLAFGVIIGANVLLSTMFLLYIYPLWILLFIEFYWGKMEKR
jgi:FHS family L-fucose permease-like MFS transporter